MSGFTTTGSTVLTDIEAVQPGILLWRSVTQWLGGMGFIVLGVAILPYLGVGGMQLFRLEAPGPDGGPAAPAHPRDGQAALDRLRRADRRARGMLFRIGGMSLLRRGEPRADDHADRRLLDAQRSMAAFSPFIQWVDHPLHVPGRHQLHAALPHAAPRPEGVLAGHGVAALHRHHPGRHGRSSRSDPRRRAARADAAGRDVPGRVHRHDDRLRHADYALWAPGAQVVLFLLFFLGGMAGSTAAA
jgi:trk system potassium uptake protein